MVPESYWGQQKFAHVGPCEDDPQEHFLKLWRRRDEI